MWYSLGGGSYDFERYRERLEVWLYILLSGLDPIEAIHRYGWVGAYNMAVEHS